MHAGKLNITLDLQPYRAVLPRDDPHLSMKSLAHIEREIFIANAVVESDDINKIFSAILSYAGTVLQVTKCVAEVCGGQKTS
jgi:hypothetical protein